MYHVRILNEATAELARLSPPISRQVVKKINWLAEHLQNLYPEALTGHLLGLYKLTTACYTKFWKTNKPLSFTKSGIVGTFTREDARGRSFQV